jgi:hypothetical protein
MLRVGRALRIGVNQARVGLFRVPPRLYSETAHAVSRAGPCVGV